MSRSQTKRKKSSAGKNVAVFFIVFILLEALLIFGLTRLFKNEDSVVKISRFSFFIMDSDNMGQEPPKDSLVVVSNGVPSDQKTGSAVLAKNVEGEGTTVGWLYEVGTKGDTVDHLVYTIYQTKSPDKMFDLTGSDIVGQATSYYITAGKIITFVKTPFGMAVAGGAPLLLMIIIELIIVAAHRSSDDDFDYEDDTEMLPPTDNVTLDDFLYGGQGDEVYNGGKPSDNFADEFGDQFEDKYAGMMNKNAKPDFDVNAPEAYEEDVEAFMPQQPEAPVYEEEPVQQPVYEEPVPAPAPAPAPAQQSNVDPSYYERASKMIDDAVAPKAEVQPEAVEAAAPVAAQPEAPAQERPRRPQQPHPGAPRRRPPQGGARPAPRRRPAPPRAQHHAAPHKDANATLEELMKLMEEEQKKLRDQQD